MAHSGRHGPAAAASPAVKRPVIFAASGWEVECRSFDSAPPTGSAAREDRGAHPVGHPRANLADLRRPHCGFLFSCLLAKPLAAHLFVCGMAGRALFCSTHGAGGQRPCGRLRPQPPQGPSEELGRMLAMQQVGGG
jgi:hypothetical protein